MVEEANVDELAFLSHLMTKYALHYQAPLAPHSRRALHDVLLWAA